MGILRADRITGLGGANAIKGSAHFHGGGDCGGLETEVSSDFQFGSNDFTIEVWANWSGFDSSGFETIVKSGNTNGSNSMFQFDYKSSESKLRIIPYVSDSSVVKQVSFTPIFDRWYHLAAVRDGNNLKIFIDGTQTGGDLAFSDTIDTETTGLSIGKRAMSDENNGYERNFNGYLSNLRIVNGTAIYTADFTPPTNQLEKTSDTVLLALQSPGNLFQEATGKKLYVAADRLSQQSVTPSRFTPNSPVGFSTTTDVGSQYGTTFDGFGNFATSTYMVPPGGNTRERNRGRALWMGGYAPSQYRTMIDFVNIQSLGNAQHFGELGSTSTGEGSECSSSTRAIQGGGSLVNTMEFVTIANESNITNFGDLTVARRSLDALSNDTRGIWAGGTTNPAMSDVIDFVTIATAGDAADFGNLTVGRRNIGTAASPTRGLFAGGNPGSSPLTDDTIDYITIASAGDAIDFGNLSSTFREGSGCSNGTRGVFNVGGPGSDVVNTLEFITIASTGNTTDYGDLFYAVGNAGGTSNGTRGVFGGGSGAAYTNIIQFITIATTGDAQDFGDLTFTRIPYGATSDSHGGIS
jgi:hypothetical protein